jgi:hypothetical protein
MIFLSLVLPEIGVPWGFGGIAECVLYSFIYSSGVEFSTHGREMYLGPGGRDGSK